MKMHALVAVMTVLMGTLFIEAMQDDPFLWLEEVEARNAETLAKLAETATYRGLYDDVLEILTAQDRIAYPSTVGDMVYNFWTDAEHERGIYRRTPLDGYLSGDPEWEVVLDIDALAEAEAVPWAFAGLRCLTPEYRGTVNLTSPGQNEAS